MSARTHDAPRKDEMRSNQKSASAMAIEHHTPSMIAGAVMMGAACIIGVCGMITGGTAVFAAIRHYLQESEMTPSEMIKHRLDQGKAAAAATATAWQQHNGVRTPAGRVRA
jgi:hypothetical protein